MATVLILDDDEDLRATMRWVLEEEGIEVFEAGTTTEAEAIVKQHAQRLTTIFVDWGLPDDDSVNLVRTLRASTDFDGDIVACSGISTGAGYLMAAGCNQLLLKPFDGPELLSFVKPR